MAASLLTVGGGLGGTILYAKWDPKFRSSVEKSVPYSDQLFDMVLGAPPSPPVPIQKKPETVKPLQISSLSEATKDSKQPKAKAKKSDPAPPPSVEEAPAPAPALQSLEEASAEAAHIISAISEVPSVPAPGTSDESPSGHSAAGQHWIIHSLLLMTTDPQPDRSVNRQKHSVSFSLHVLKHHTFWFISNHLHGSVL